MLALVLSVKPYDFQDDKGQSIKGFSLFFIDPNTPITRGGIGHEVIKLSGSYDILNQFPSTGMYDIDIAPKMKGKTPSWELKGAKPVKQVAIKQICEGLLR